VQDLDALVLGSRRRGDALAAALGSGHLRVARAGGSVVGSAVFAPSFFGRWFIELLVVHPEHRRRGVGAALARRCEAECPEGGIFTSTNESNRPMRRLLEGLGYEESGYVENLDEGDPELIFFKRLPAPG
jgi:ribosomal protein S18 acetylase RimI-like enzyme